MVYKLTPPMHVGDLVGGITVDQLQLVSVSINFDTVYASKGNAILSVILLHPSSGWKHNIVYQDASALTFWNSTMDANSACSNAIFQKLIADGKLPAGTLA